MPSYMLQVAYTPEAWASQLKNPQNRIEAVRPAVEQLGGTIEGAWYAFGDYDLVAIVEMPDNKSAAAFALAAAAGGACKAIKTTPLLTLDEGQRAIQAAGGVGYVPPAG
jgi:uncharacterized protein with GYD domain